MEILCNKSCQKGVVDGVGGHVKSLVRQRQTVLSQNDDRIIVQSSKDFADAAMQELLYKTKIFHIF